MTCSRTLLGGTCSESQRQLPPQRQALQSQAGYTQCNGVMRPLLQSGPQCGWGMGLSWERKVRTAWLKQTYVMTLPAAR